MRLQNKVVIVTGGTSGIGAAITRAVIREGGQVLVHGINEAEGIALTSELGAKSHLCIADLKDQSAPEKIVQSCIAQFGRIDGIVNNAAVIKNANIKSITMEHYQEILQVNLTSALFLFKAAYEELKKNSGSVLNIGSINAYAGESSLLAYSIAKVDCRQCHEIWRMLTALMESELTSLILVGCSPSVKRNIKSQVEWNPDGHSGYLVPIFHSVP